MHSNPPNYIPTSEEQDLIWKFRFHLSTDRHALVVFLRCINWETATEVRQALALLEKWDPMDSSDALALLSPDFTQPALRKYAIARLQMSSDDELLLYLLQLVQALKYENLQQFEVSRVFFCALCDLTLLYALTLRLRHTRIGSRPTRMSSSP